MMEPFWIRTRKINGELLVRPAPAAIHKHPNSDTLYWIDAGKNEDEVTGYEIKKNAETILGNVCDALILNIPKNKIPIFSQ